MTRISASKFKEQCLAILESIGPEGVVITKHGRPVARLVPFETDCRGLIGIMKGRLNIKGDIQSTGVRWDAES